MSSNKTANLQLNQWQPGDAFLREEFNEDNRKMDAFAAGGSCVAGHYTGNGQTKRTVSLGFKPKLVLIWGQYSDYANSSGFIFADVGCTRYGTMEISSAGMMMLVDDGFYLSDPSYFNTNGRDYDYVAFR